MGAGATEVRKAPGSEWDSATTTSTSPTGLHWVLWVGTGEELKKHLGAPGFQWVWRVSSRKNLGTSQTNYWKPKENTDLKPRGEERDIAYRKTIPINFASEKNEDKKKLHLLSIEKYSVVLDYSSQWK